MFSALDYLLGTIGKPGRAVRGLLSGNSQEGLGFLPFSDTLGLTDPSQAVSGRDLVRHAGLNTGNEFADAITGFGAEVATDPLSYFGGTALKAAAPALRRLMAGSAVQKVAKPGGEFFSLMDQFSPYERLIPDHAPPPVSAPGPVSAIRPSEDWLSPALAKRVDDPFAKSLYEAPDPGLPGFPRLPLGNPDGTGPSILRDIMQEASGHGALPDAHRVAASAWQENLPALVGESDALGLSARGLMTHPEWGPGVSRRLIELGATLDNPAAYGVPSDLTPLLQQQRAVLGDLTGMADHLNDVVRFEGSGQKVGANTVLGLDPAAQQAINWGHGLHDMPIGRDISQARMNAQATQGGMHRPEEIQALLAETDNPLLRFDPKVARAEMGREQMGAAHEMLRNQVPMFRAANLAEEPGYAEGVLSMLTKGSYPVGTDAIRGAARIDPATGSIYDEMLRGLMHAGYELPPKIVRRLI